MSVSVKTTCPYCGVGCGVVATLSDEGRVTVKGDPEHPANFGRLCSKGAALADTIGHDGRLLYPEVNGDSESWANALNLVADRFSHAIRNHGPESVAFYVSGQLLTEDYYAANKLMKGFIGTGNIDTNSRLCMSSAVAGYKRAFGSDTVPCSYEDLERAKLIVLAGSNTAWCHPVLFQRIRQAKKENPDLMVVVIDPRQTPTCDIADLFLPIKPGTDQVLFNGLLAYLDQQGELNEAFVNHFTEGVDDALVAANEHAADPQNVAKHCELDIAVVEKFYRLFARTERVVTVYSQGINQWSTGTDRVNSIINCHLLTGRIGRPGMGPFSFTGQPNAMGGREVGGLANQLAAHMAIDNAEHRELVQQFWQSPYIADREGLKAVDLFQMVNEGKIKALWIMATNPAVSLPDSDFIRQAMASCEFVVVSDCVRRTDTTQLAHVLLPAQAWGERDGMVTNSERRISRQRAFLPIPGDAKPDWWIISEIAKRMGYAEYFKYNEARDVFIEHAALSGYENNGARDFDISGLSSLTYDEYDDLEPVQWPVTEAQPEGTTRLFGDGRFFTPTGKAQFVRVENKQPASQVDEQYPLILNSGRIRDQWHTMTRTGKSAKLSAHIVEPYVEIYPEDAARFGIENGSLVKVSSARSSLILRAEVSEAQQRGSVFVPIHWNDQFASKAYVDALIATHRDPVSGQPEFKHTPVHIETYQASWYGFLLSRRRLELNNASYWACTRANGLWRYEIAGEETTGDWADYARQLLCTEAEEVDWIEYMDKSQCRYRAARIEYGKLESCIFIAPSTQLPERDWLARIFAHDTITDKDRRSLLTGKPADGQHDSGHVVCACFGVGVNTIMDAIKKQNLTTAEEIGAALKAGTNCGSCVPELKKLLASAE